MSKLTVKDIRVKNKKVLVRVDFNVPINKDGRITDDKRIRASLPTILYLLESGAKVILISHLGRPRDKRDTIFSLKSCVDLLSNFLKNFKVFFVNECIGEKVENIVKNFRNWDVLLLENLRFYREEIENNLDFARKLSSLANIYVNDAFGVIHRKHASVCGITNFMKFKVMGLLLAKELEYINFILNNPTRLFVAILGGSKISDKIGVIENLLKKVDLLILGGSMTFTFLKAKGVKIGNSFFESGKIDFAKNILLEYEQKIFLPFDCMVTNFLNFKSKAVGLTKYTNINNIKSGWYGVDIGIKTIEYISNILFFAKTIIWNGPLGIFEINNSSNGTFLIAKAIGKATKNGAMSVVGGGDSALAVKDSGVHDAISHVSTGGGALLRFIEGNILLGFNSLDDL